jgi:protein-S-isoprenylcysteine O-methyltransferase Ste14
MLTKGRRSGREGKIVNMDQGSNSAASIPVTAMSPGPSTPIRKATIAIVILCGVGFLSIAGSYERDGGLEHESIEWIGIVLLVLCILGRTWSTLYIGGRKNSALVTQGPYSICRNPLYLFSIIGAIGVGAQFGSVTVAVVCGLFAWIVFLWTARREEAVLIVAFQDEYRRYMDRVPRFWPTFDLWESPMTIVVHPRQIVVTFLDALLFLTAVPLMETFEYLHDSGILPVLLRLP